MNVSTQDIAVLRELAKKYMEYASLPVQEEKRELWRQLNKLNMVKPMVTIDQMPWHELDVDGSLVCRVENPYFHWLEWRMRMDIYKWEHLPVDMVLNPYLTLDRLISNTGFGMAARRLDHDSTGNIQSHLFADQLEELEDVEKIKTPVLSLNREAEADILAAAHEIFDGIAPLKWGGIMLHSGLWDQITFWKGVENCYIDLLDRPELIHAIMERYTNAFLAQIEQINRLGVYDITGNICHCSYTFSDSLPTAACDHDHPTTHDGWTFTMAQLFSSVSPEINAEFEVPYISKILSQFGSVYYGCCERLDDRLDIIDRMPNIRKISCSPWSDRENFASLLNGEKYIMSNKPNPALLAGSTFDEDLVRADLRRTIAAAKTNGICLEMLLKDISTVKNQPQRLWRWAEIAAEETLRAAE